MSKGIPVIYIAGKLSDLPPDYIENLRKMTLTDGELRRLGFAVINPGLDIITGLVVGGLRYDDYFGNNSALLLKSDAVFFMDSWRLSSGAKAEHALAHKNRIPIYYEINTMVVRFRSRLGVSKA